MSEPTPYENQVGGWHSGSHTSVLKGDPGQILKPLKVNANPTYDQNQRPTSPSRQNKKALHNDDRELVPVCPDELEFYKRLQASQFAHDIALKSLMPVFHGSQIIVLKNNEELPHLALEDLSHGHKLPCVADIKIGRTFSYPGKLQSAQRKYSTQKEHGFCLTGLRIYHPDTGDLLTETRPDACKKLSVSQAFEALEQFCQSDSGFSQGLRSSILAQLYKIREWFQEFQGFYCIRCSSILIVYDASQLRRSQAINSEAANQVVSTKPEPQVTVRMIDFAHVFHAEGEKDENYFFGLENLIKFFSKELS